MKQTTKLLLKFVGLAISYIAFSWLLPQCAKVSDTWFDAWFFTTLCSFTFAVFFTVWIAESIINWNK